MFGHVIGFLATPNREWEKIGAKPAPENGIVYTLVLAVLPVVAWYYGVTAIGWRVADGEIIRLTTTSAAVLVSLFYLAMIAAVGCIGYFVHWMARNYGSESTLLQGITVVGYCATPMFVLGLVGFYPILWLDMLVAVLAVSWSLYLLYIGIPAVMHIPKEQGFLFASAIVAVCLVILIGMMGVTVVLWDMGLMPVFAD